MNKGFAPFLLEFDLPIDARELAYYNNVRRDYCITSDGRNSFMTDSEKLDLLLERIGNMESDITDLKKETSSIKRQIMKSTAELKAMDEMVLDEVERVHAIIDRHIEDKAVHTA